VIGMKNKKGLLISATAFLLLGVGLFTNNLVEAKKEPSVISYDAIVIKFEDLKDLAKEAPIIVQATFTGERETILGDLTKGELFRSDSVVEIKKVIKGDLKKDQKIIVYEPAILKDDETYITIEGYNLMNEEGKYTLFLTPAKGMDGYALMGVYQGKYDNNIKKEAKKAKQSSDYEDLKDTDFFGEEAKHYNKLKEDVLKKYKW